MTEETKIIKHEMKEQKHETPIVLLRYDKSGVAIHDDKLSKDKNPSKKM